MGEQRPTGPCAMCALYTKHTPRRTIDLEMPFKVFLSYSTDPDEQAIVWRLQTLAAAHGIQLFVPQRPGFTSPSPRKNAPILSDQIRAALDHADCVLAIITTSTDQAVQKELNYALGKGMLIVPVVEQGVAENSFLRKFHPIFRFSRFDGNPGEVETQVLEFLRRKKLDKENRQALGAIVAIGMGLLLLSGLAKE
jgi:nucleoside 2-deoxyribosyltransferase